MSPAINVCRSVAEGLIFGFTFAIGWFAALLLLGAVVVYVRHDPRYVW